MRSVESAECRKFSISFSIFHFNFRRNVEKQCVKIKKKKKLDELLHFKMRRAGMVMSVVVFSNAHVLLSLRTTRRCKYVLDQDLVDHLADDIFCKLSLYPKRFKIFMCYIVVISGSSGSYSSYFRFK